jgi:predicted ester cyclase
VVPIKRLIEISVQPTILSFATNFFMSMTKKGKIAGLIPFGKRVRAESLVPMLVQVEAFLRCLRKSSVG